MERRTANLLWAAMAFAVVGALVPAFGLHNKLSALDATPATKAPVGKWTSYLAPESDCPGATDFRKPQAVQERTMLCLIDWARAKAGLAAPAPMQILRESARLKASDIAVCGDFRHEACGKDPSAVFDQVGYGADSQGRSIGENLAWGSGLAGSPLHVLNGWLNSPPHRALLFRTDWTEQGIALLPAPGFEGYAEAAVWVSHFGVRR